jgi:hypothetical protein
MKTLTVFDDDYKTIMDLEKPLFGFDKSQPKEKIEAITVTTFLAFIKKVNEELAKKDKVVISYINNENKVMGKYTIIKEIP